MGGAQRLAVGAVAPTISTTFRDAAGEPVDAGAVTVAVADWAGAEVLPAGTATTPGGEGVEVELPAAAVADVTQLVATWTASGTTVTTTVDVVGSRLVWPDEVAALPGITNTAEEISAAIAWFEDLALRVMHWSPVERFRRPKVRAHADGRIRLPDAKVLDLLGITWLVPGLDGIDETNLAEFDVGPGGVLLGWYRSGSARVAYTHGDADGGQHLHDAALTAIRVHLLEGDAGRPALSVADGVGGTTRISVAGPGRPTGLPDVDQALNDLAFDAWGA